jgi:hypothetical protein
MNIDNSVSNINPSPTEGFFISHKQDPHFELDLNFDSGISGKKFIKTYLYLSLYEKGYQIDRR